VKSLLGRIYRADPVLAVTGWIHVFFLFAAFMAAPWDSREILGINPWIKPIKFAASITIYLWTLALFMEHLPGPKAVKRLIRWGVSLLMLGEIACICLQSARGVPSHFNVDKPFDASIFGLMGLMILANTLLIALFLFFYVWEFIDIDRTVLMGIRFGLILFMFGSLEGMIIVLNQAHAIGVPDGGPGLPFLNWATNAGDLRVAHAVGLHAMQVLPLAALAISRLWKNSSKSLQMGLLALFGILYIGVFVVAFRMAVAGQPIIAM